MEPNHQLGVLQSALDSCYAEKPSSRFDLATIKPILGFCCECAAQDGRWEPTEIVAGIFTSGTTSVAIASRDGAHGPAYYHSWFCQRHYDQRVEAQRVRVRAGLDLERPLP